MNDFFVVEFHILYVPPDQSACAHTIHNWTKSSCKVFFGVLSAKNLGILEF